jgi:hypothetical protein
MECSTPSPLVVSFIKNRVFLLWHSEFIMRL